MAPSIARFPPGTGGGAGGARGGQGKGDPQPQPHRWERHALGAPDHTGQRGRPRKRLKVLATDKGYEAQALRQRLRQRGLRAQLSKRVWKTRKNRGRPIKKVVPRFQAERTFAWFQKK